MLVPLMLALLVPQTKLVIAALVLTSGSCVRLKSSTQPCPLGLGLIMTFTV